MKNVSGVYKLADKSYQIAMSCEWPGAPWRQEHLNGRFSANLQTANQPEIKEFGPQDVVKFHSCNDDQKESALIEKGLIGRYETDKATLDWMEHICERRFCLTLIPG